MHRRCAYLSSSPDGNCFHKPDLKTWLMKVSLIFLSSHFIKLLLFINFLWIRNDVCVKMCVFWDTAQFHLVSAFWSLSIIGLLKRTFGFCDIVVLQLYVLPVAGGWELWDPTVVRHQLVCVQHHDSRQLLPRHETPDHAALQETCKWNAGVHALKATGHQV